MKRLLVVLLCLGLVGCATAPPTLEKPIKKSELFIATYNQVWDALTKSLVSSGEVLSVVEKDSGIISFTKAILPSMVGRFALAPKGYSWSEAVAFVNISLIRVSEEQTRVNIETKFSAVGINNSYAVSLALFTGFKGKPSSEKWTLYSSGLLEKEYFSSIEILLPR